MPANRRAEERAALAEVWGAPGVAEVSAALAVAAAQDLAVVLVAVVARAVAEDLDPAVVRDLAVVADWGAAPAAVGQERAAELDTAVAEERVLEVELAQAKVVGGEG
jgi:hypothetical protein